jgi:hypothetical protein
MEGNHWRLQPWREYPATSSKLFFDNYPFGIPPSAPGVLKV